MCLAISLMLKPHDAGLVWLYFLLAGGIYRKRALQALVADAIKDEAWLKGEFISSVQQRGAAIIKARGASSAASAANAIADSVASIVNPTAAGDWHSVCLHSDGSYGIEKGLICSFPVRSDGQNLQIVQGLELNEFARGKIDASVNELKGERTIAAELGMVK